MRSLILSVCRCKATALTCSRRRSWSSTNPISKFRCLALAYDAIHKGGNMPCILNAANEVANAAFRRGECSFLGMADIIERTMQQATFDSHPDLDVYLNTDSEARQIARQLVSHQS